MKNISHYHNDYEIVYVNSGNATIIIDESVFSLSSKQCLFVHGNSIHCITSDEDTVVTVLKINGRFFEKNFSSKTLLSPIINDTSSIESSLAGIEAELKSEADNSGLMADCIATQLIINLFRSEKTTEQSRQFLSKSPSHVLYNEIYRKIATEYNTVTFDEMAKHLHFSEQYFSKVFHNIFGMTFTQYLNTVKTAAAIEKIKENKLSMTEISGLCGFNTIRNFNRVFKKFTGYAPNSLPSDYVFMYSLQDGYGLDPTLNCTVIID